MPSRGAGGNWAWDAARVGGACCAHTAAGWKPDQTRDDARQHTPHISLDEARTASAGVGSVTLPADRNPNPESRVPSPESRTPP